MKLYALKRKDGGVEIMQVMEGCTVPECIAKWSASRQAEMTGEYREISPADLPQDRSQRDKWYDTGSGIGVRE